MIKLNKIPPIPRLRHAPSLSNDGHQFIRSCGSPNRAMRDMMYSIYSSSAVSYCIIADDVEHGKRWVTSIVFSIIGIEKVEKYYEICKARVS